MKQVSDPTNRSGCLAVVLALSSLMLAMWVENLDFAFFFHASSFFGVVVPSLIWIKVLSRRIPPDQLFLKVWQIPLWFGILTSILGVVVVLANLGAGDMASLGAGIAMAIVANIFGIVMGPVILLPLGLYRAKHE